MAQRDDEMLQKIAAAAQPHRLGLIYSRYGQPAPVLGESYGLKNLRQTAAQGVADSGGSEQEARDQEADEAAIDRLRAEGTTLSPDDAAAQAAGEQEEAAGEQDADVDNLEARTSLTGLFPDGVPQHYRHVLNAHPDMGMEDFWHLYGHELESKHNVSRDDFFNAVEREP